MDVREPFGAEVIYFERIIALIQADKFRMEALRAVNTLGLKDWLIAAGFVRNAIWDEQFGVKTELSDVDVIYFSQEDISEERDLALEEKLTKLSPNVPWSVKNQVRMHVPNGDRPYKSTLDAMSFWPEKQTALGVKIGELGALELHNYFPLYLLYNAEITHNPKRDIDVFKERVGRKGWLKKWPKLKV